MQLVAVCLFHLFIKSAGQPRRPQSPMARKGVQQRSAQCGWTQPHKKLSPALASKERAKYLIISQPRSGSTWFGTRVGSHPCVSYRHELGHQIWMAENQRKFSEHCFDAYFRDALGEAVTSNQISEDRATCNATIAVGGKIWGSQLLVRNSHPRSIADRILRYIKQNNVKLLILERTNIIDKMISSLEVSDETNKLGMHCRIQGNKNQTSCGKHAADVVQKPVQISISVLRDLVTAADQNRKTLFDSLRASNIDFLYLQYEKLRRNDDLFADVVQFLGFPRSDSSFLQDRLVKRITKPRKQLISNYAQVHAELASMNRLHWLFDDN